MSRVKLTNAPANRGWMVKSGIECIDERLAGLVEGRAHVLTGSPGSGKTVACLEFLNRGLEDGERCAMLTMDDPADLLAQCEFLGLSFDDALASGQLVLLRYQLDFMRRCGRLASPEPMFDEFRRLLGEEPPKRLVIDSVMPLLEAGPASGATMSTLVRWIEELGSTSLLTVPGNLEAGFDRRFEPLVRRAMAIVHFALERDRSIRVELQKVRMPVDAPGPLRCRIQPGRGLVSIASSDRRYTGDASDAPHRRLLVLELGHAFPGELLVLLEPRFEVHHHRDVISGLSTLAAGGASTIVIGVDRDSLRSALALVRDLRRAGNHAPIMLITASALRSSDGARVLRAGVDEFVPASMQLDELVLRVEALARRGRSSSAATPPEGLPAMQASGGRARGALSADEFRAAVRRKLEHDALPFFTILTIRPGDGSDISLLAELVVGAIRIDGGDAAGIVDDDHVAVLLHSARRKDVAPFVDRLRAMWQDIGGSELAIDTAAWPAEESKVDELLAVSGRAE